MQVPLKKITVQAFYSGSDFIYRLHVNLAELKIKNFHVFPQVIDT